MADTWVLVADRSHARFFHADKPAAKLTEVESLLHQEGRLHEGDLVSDAPGTNAGVAGRGATQMGRDEPAKHQEAQLFARQICGRLDEALQQKRFEHLYVVCEPGFLGVLRPHLTPGLKQHLKSEIHKNLTAMNGDDIRAVLPQYL